MGPVSCSLPWQGFKDLNNSSQACPVENPLPVKNPFLAQTAGVTYQKNLATPSVLFSPPHKADFSQGPKSGPEFQKELFSHLSVS